MKSKKNILITGASGFIGSFLTDEAIKRNYNVYAIVRKSTNTDSLQQKQIQITVIDFANNTDIIKKISKLPHFEYVIHNAGVTKASKKEDFFNINFHNTKRFIESLKKMNKVPLKFIYISSLAAFGPAKNNNAVTSESIPQPLSEYGKSKLAAEQYIIEKSNIPYIIFRPTGVYGPGDKDFLKTIKLINMGIDIKIGKHTQILTFIYVKDLVRLIFDALESPFLKKSYFITDGNLYSNKNFSNCISNLLNKKPIHLHFPIWSAKIIAELAEIFSLFSKKSTLLRVDKIAELSAHNWNCDIRPLISDFNFKAEYNLEDGMRETLGWYKKNAWLKSYKQSVY